MLNLKLIASIVLITLMYSCSKSIKTTSKVVADSTQNLEIDLPVEVDSPAEFVGGNKALMQYLLQNLRYPIDAQKSGVVGRILVDFIVLKTGEISNIKTSANANKILAKEAIRLIKSMPKWKPATLKGEPVNSKFMLPITFRTEGMINR